MHKIKQCTLQITSSISTMGRFFTRQPEATSHKRHLERLSRLAELITDVFNTHTHTRTHARTHTHTADHATSVTIGHI